MKAKFDTDHLVMLFVNSTGSFAEMELGSELAIVSVYKSENLGNFEDTTNPVLLNEPWQNTSIRLKL